MAPVELEPLESLLRFLFWLEERGGKTMTDPVISMAFKPTEFPISPLIFGHFIEFIENCMIGGVYDPDSPASDEKGTR